MIKNIQRDLGSNSVFNNVNHHNAIINGGFSLPSRLNNIQSSGLESVLPKNIKNEVNISGDVIKLHENNHQQQIDNITNLVTKADHNITREMVARVLDAGNHGSVSQQELNLRPETALVILTLFEAQNIPSTLLSTAAKLIKEFSGKKDLNCDADIKKVLNKTQKSFDQQLDNFLSAYATPENLVVRYQEKYVDPAIKQQLSEYFSDEVIDSRSMDNFLVSDLNTKQEQYIQTEIKEYCNFGQKQYGDKYQHLNNIFRHIEQKIAIISPLKIKMALSEPVRLDTSAVNAKSDATDGISNPKEAMGSPSSAATYNHNTMHFPLSENITEISSQNPELSYTPPEESKPTKQSVSLTVKHHSLAKLSRATLSQSVKEPEIDDELPKVDNSIYQSKGFVASTLRGNQPLAVKVASERQSAGQEAIKQFLPKNGHLLGSYLKNGEVPTKVTLSTEGALTRNQSDKDIYRGEHEAPKKVVDTASYLPNSDAPVTLTERGALTRDQSKKNAYTTG
ncbi:hypothetical protein KDV38_02905 [Providencia rettgeri]